ncbi:MAG: hypothetical protein FJ147_08080 [Deltaproteobacteria bacterium]|nr:hypothetical protein [Deltaproteobacteria bacterium]
MTDTMPHDRFASAFSTLATEGVPAELLSSLSVATANAVRHPQGEIEVFLSNGHRIVERSPYGSLTFFLPSTYSQLVSQRLATFDRYGRLLLLLYRDAAGRLTRFKARGLDSRFLGVERRTTNHIGWGMSDSVSLLEGETGFTVAHPLTFFRSVAYEDLDALPPLDDPVRLPLGAGSTLLNVLALLAHDQGKAILRYRGPYPTERLFATLSESFRYRGEPGAMRERFAQGAEETAVQLAMKEAPVDWEPLPHERFFPAVHTCVQLRNGVEKVYDRGRVYYRPDLAGSAYAIRTSPSEEQPPRYIAGLALLGQAIEDHLVLDAHGEVLERPTVQTYAILRGPFQLSDDWKALLVRLIAAESAAMLHSALWPVVDELTLEWESLHSELWSQSGNTIALHAGMVTVYRRALAQIKSAGEGLLLAARFTSELSRLIGPLVRARAQERLAGLSSEAQQISLFFTSSAPQGLSDNELRAFLTRLALGEELPKVEAV